MTDVIEKAARAMCCPDGNCRAEGMGRQGEYLVPVPCDEPAYKDVARAALKVILKDMMEPSEGMVDVYFDPEVYAEVPATDDLHRYLKAAITTYAHENGMDLEDGDG